MTTPTDISEITGLAAQRGLKVAVSHQEGRDGAPGTGTTIILSSDTFKWSYHGDIERCYAEARKVLWEMPTVRAQEYEKRDKRLARSRAEPAKPVEHHTTTVIHHRDEDDFVDTAVKVGAGVLGGALIFSGMESMFGDDD